MRVHARGTHIHARKCARFSVGVFGGEQRQRRQRENARIEYHRPVFNINQVMRDRLCSAAAFHLCVPGRNSREFAMFRLIVERLMRNRRVKRRLPNGLLEQFDPPTSSRWRSRRWKEPSAFNRKPAPRWTRRRDFEPRPRAFLSRRGSVNIETAAPRAGAEAQTARHSDDAKSRQGSYPSLHSKSKPSLKIKNDRETTCEVRCSRR